MVVCKISLESGRKARIVVRTNKGRFMKTPKPKKFSFVHSCGEEVICWRDVIGRFSSKPHRKRR